MILIKLADSRKDVIVPVLMNDFVDCEVGVSTGYIGAIGGVGGGGGFGFTRPGVIVGHRIVAVLIHEYRTCPGPSPGDARFTATRCGEANDQYSVGLNGTTDFLQYPGAGRPQFGKCGDGTGAAIGDRTNILNATFVKS